MKLTYLAMFRIILKISKGLKNVPLLAESACCCAGKFIKFRVSQTAILTDAHDAAFEKVNDLKKKFSCSQRRGRWYSTSCGRPKICIWIFFISGCVQTMALFDSGFVQSLALFDSWVCFRISLLFTRVFFPPNSGVIQTFTLFDFRFCLEFVSVCYVFLILFLLFGLFFV